LTGSTKSESAESAPTNGSDDAALASSGTTADTVSPSDEGAEAHGVDAADAGASSTSDAAQDAGAQKTFGGLGPREAARRRWDRKRAQEQDEDQARAADARKDIVLVRVTVETGKVIDRLAKDAQQGNTQAARELREWLARVEQETDTSLSTLDRVTRQRMKARLLAEVEAEGQGPEGVRPDPSPQRPERPDDAVEHGAMGVGAEAAGPGA